MDLEISLNLNMHAGQSFGPTVVDETNFFVDTEPTPNNFVDTEVTPNKLVDTQT